LKKNSDYDEVFSSSIVKPKIRLGQNEGYKYLNKQSGNMEEKICPTCRGTGQTTRSHGVLIGNERHIETITCITCNGRGRIKNPKRTSSSSSYGKQISGNKSKPTSSGKPSAPLDAAGILALIGFIVGGCSYLPKDK
jgi:hypothetical protein